MINLIYVAIALLFATLSGRQKQSTNVNSCELIGRELLVVQRILRLGRIGSAVIPTQR